MIDQALGRGRTNTDIINNVVLMLAVFTLTNSYIPEIFLYSNNYIIDRDTRYPTPQVM